MQISIAVEVNPKRGTMQSWRNYGFWRDPEEKAAARARLRRVGGRAKSEAIEVCSSSVSEEEPLACITGIQDEVAALKPKKRTIPTPDRKAEPLVCSTGIQDVVAVLKPKSNKNAEAEAEGDAETEAASTDIAVCVDEQNTAETAETAEAGVRRCGVNWSGS